MKNKNIGPFKIVKKTDDNGYDVNHLKNMATPSTFNIVDLYKNFPPKESSFLESNSKTSSFQGEEIDEGYNGQNSKQS